MWRGPNRTGLSQETDLLKEWPKGGLKRLWERTAIGGGYSTPAVVGDRVYLMVNREGKECVAALAVKDGLASPQRKQGNPLLGPHPWQGSPLVEPFHPPAISARAARAAEMV
jgi:hypothetical protein